MISVKDESCDKWSSRINVQEQFKQQRNLPENNPNDDGMIVQDFTHLASYLTLEPLQDVFDKPISIVCVKKIENRVIGRIQKFTFKDVIKCSKLCSIAAWLLTITNSTIMMYVVCYTPLLNATMTPIGTYISTTKLLPAQIGITIYFVYISAAWAFPSAMTFWIAVCIWTEFQKVRSQFKEAMTLDRQCTGEKGGQFSGNIECYRIRHQKIVRMVKRVDKYLCFFYGSNLIGHVAATTVMLYVVMYFQLYKANAILMFTGLYWILMGCLELVVMATGAILVNHSVSIFTNIFNKTQLKLE